jgi:hypothetical protein
VFVGASADQGEQVFVLLLVVVAVVGGGTVAGGSAPGGNAHRDSERQD